MSAPSPRRNARGRGITVFLIEEGARAWRPIQEIAGLTNPSYLAMGAGGRVLYAVHGDQDYASAYRQDPDTGQLTALGRAATGGHNGVHLALAPSGRHLIVPNYAGGTVAALPLLADGRLARFTDRVNLPGSPGPHRSEQTASHPHQVLFDPEGGFVLVPDKGSDGVCVFEFDAEAGTLRLASRLCAAPGAGPRHAAFHPALPICWVVNELDSTVTTCRWSDGVLQTLDVVPALPADCSFPSTAAAIAVTPDGRHVVTSNRGHQSIARFAADPATGQLRQLGWTQAPGADPRFMTWHQDRLYVASERDDRIGCYRVSDDGDLRPDILTVPTPSPATIAFC